MPVSKPSELPENGGGRWPHTGFRSVQWGDLEVGYTVAPPIDCAPGYKGLPGDLCQCPHYGYVFKGRMRATYPGSDWRTMRAPWRLTTASVSSVDPPSTTMISCVISREASSACRAGSN